MFIYDREPERQRIRELLLAKRSFLIHGPVGVGKSLLLRHALHEIPSILHCGEYPSEDVLYRSVAHQLWMRREHSMVAAFRGENELDSAESSRLRHAGFEALRTGAYGVAIDPLPQPLPNNFTAAVCDIFAHGIAHLVTVARSCGESFRWMSSLAKDILDVVEITNFPPSTAVRFMDKLLERRALLSAENSSEFIGKVMELADGNPGAIVALLEMGNYPKYRSELINVGAVCGDFLDWKRAH